MKKRQTVIRRSPFAIIISVVITALGFFGLLENSGMGFAVLFVFGGILFTAFLAWKPLVIVSVEGITVPTLRGNVFVPWYNISRVDVVLQNVGMYSQSKQMGVFVRNKNDIEGPFRSAAIQYRNAKTLAPEAPDIVINISFSLVRAKKIMAVVKKYQR
ncbi:MAG: hypothetical protein FWB96_10690 [Defluviitaleaceae bacterium]|nr:hypothetical protein [Defluviitaleaceae bacterium]MCL2263355.1 hypothetical protein [Defluviitaleaceae bacterium]